MSGRRASGAGGFERRRAPRLGPAELNEPIFIVGARLVDLSRLGLLMEAPVPLELESKVRLRLVVGGDKSEVEARVARCVQQGSGMFRTWGVGMEFTSVPAATRERLDRALSGGWSVRPRSA